MAASWIESANRPDCDFPLENLPWCRFNGGRLGVGIGDLVLEVENYDRGRLTSLLRHDAVERPPERAFHRMADVSFDLPFAIGDYTDFYASVHHATNVGKLFRPDNPLLPNYRHIPIAYHGRASSVVVSGRRVKRPAGQLGEGRFGPTAQLDYELELGIWIGEGNELGTPIPVMQAGNHVAGFCIVNDWSARDIQRWEYQPLGPFLGKSFATTVSPWVVLPEALHGMEAAERTETLPYLRPAGVVYDITMEVYVNGELTGRSNTRDLYWTVAQMIAHHTSNGCNLRRGDLLASGTVSGPEPGAHGCLLETGKPYLEDGDEVVMRAYAAAPGKPRIGFGECRGIIVK
jgi:fumarylacetoacetase